MKKEIPQVSTHRRWQKTRKVFKIYLHAADVEMLEALAAHEGLPLATTIRRAISEMATRKLKL